MCRITFQPCPLFARARTHPLCPPKALPKKYRHNQQLVRRRPPFSQPLPQLFDPIRPPRLEEFRMEREGKREHSIPFPTGPWRTQIATVDRKQGERWKWQALTYKFWKWWHNGSELCRCSDRSKCSIPKICGHVIAIQMKSVGSGTSS
ncbi:Hypothetical predicted protein [Podarcis lilfordi]|uniref:Uncharacterized protein n=1 Tax=Podarcis lilfordi TaxID=74358 RepID=A0AA35K3J5_9SAUR|nr:Hypothetical predicted protein [Podarcis lilfordi]